MRALFGAAGGCEKIRMEEEEGGSMFFSKGYILKPANLIKGNHSGHRIVDTLEHEPILFQQNVVNIISLHNIGTIVTAILFSLSFIRAFQSS